MNRKFRVFSGDELVNFGVRILHIDFYDNALKIIEFLSF